MRLCNIRASQPRWFGTRLLVLGMFLGCSKGPQVVPVEGVVYYNDKPLPFGSVMFQPEMGQPAGAKLNEDGSFRLSTFSEFDGAIVGKHKVKVTCYESQNPKKLKQKSIGEQSLGPCLIPEKYTYSDQSGLTAEVQRDSNKPLEFRLTGPSVNFLP